MNKENIAGKMPIGSEIIFSVFVYNIVFGSGILLLPKAFWGVGYGLGLALLVLLAFLSWASCTFVIESLSLANAFIKIKEQNSRNETEYNEINNLRSGMSDLTNVQMDDLNTEEPKQNTIDQDSFFAIERKFEVAEMAQNFFGKFMLILFYILMIAYLYGDLCIYLSVVGTTLKRLSCPYNSTKTSQMMKYCDEWGQSNIFRIYVAGFFLLTGGFVFTNIKKSLVIQLLTMVLRFSVVLIVVIYAGRRISRHEEYNISVADFNGIPMFFGVCLYSFMCQHSLPSMVQYVQNHKARFNYWILCSMVVALILYSLTVLTATFSFKGEELLAIYSMNFANEGNDGFSTFLYYFLMIFPTLALSASYPIVGITLRENLITLTKIMMGRDFSPFVKMWIFPFLGIAPPFIIVMILPDSVSEFAGYVGTYAGSFVQYFIPASLVIAARRKLREHISDTQLKKNINSPRIFNNWIMPVIVILWTFLSIGVVTYYYIVSQ